MAGDAATPTTLAIKTGQCATLRRQYTSQGKRIGVTGRAGKPQPPDFAAEKILLKFVTAADSGFRSLLGPTSSRPSHSSPSFAISKPVPETETKLPRNSPQDSRLFNLRTSFRTVKAGYPPTRDLGSIHTCLETKRIPLFEALSENISCWRAIFVTAGCLPAHL